MSDPREIYELRKSFISNILQMTNLSYGDKKKKTNEIYTLTSLYHYLLSDEAVMVINPILRFGILKTFEEQFKLADVFDDLKRGDANYVENRSLLIKAVEYSESVRKTFAQIR